MKIYNRKIPRFCSAQRVIAAVRQYYGAACIGNHIFPVNCICNTAALAKRQPEAFSEIGGVSSACFGIYRYNLANIRNNYIFKSFHLNHHFNYIRFL